CVPVPDGLKFPGNARQHSDDNVHPENPRPKAGCLVVRFISSAQRQAFQAHDEWCRAHGELGKEVMKSDGKGQMESVDEESLLHAALPARSKQSRLRQNAGNYSWAVEGVF